MTIDRASVEHGARLAAEVLRIASSGAASLQAVADFQRHWNPEFAAEVARELQRLRRVEEAAKYVREHSIQQEDPHRVLNKWSYGPVVVVDPNAWFALADGLANPAAEDGDD